MSSPNVIVFFTDQQRWDCSGLQGNPLDLMPNFDRLARAGTYLSHSFSCQPLCAPARSCMQTGRYPTQTGVHVNSRSLTPGTRTLAHQFADAGYRTAYYGKWHLGPRESVGPVPEPYRGGYQDWLAANALELVSDAYDCRLWDEQSRERRLPGYRVDAMTDAAIEYIGRPRQEPFFLFLSYLEPHQQNSRDDYPAPAGYAERYMDRWIPPDLVSLDRSGRNKLAGYCGMVKRLDEALGRLCEALQQQNLWDETIILFTSDHGCHFRTRNAEYKRSCHESSIRVPTFLHGPGLRGLDERTELVSLIDLPPTLLDAAGISIPAEMQGRSILPAIRDRDAWRNEIFIQISESQNARALRTTRWKYCATVPEENAAMAIEEPFWPLYTDSELYDLARDPWEENNLVNDPAHREIRDHLRGRLTARMTEAGEPRATIVEAVPRV